MWRYLRVVDPLRWAEARGRVGIIHANFQTHEAIGRRVVGGHVDAFIHCDCRGTKSVQTRNKCNNRDDCWAYQVAIGC